MSVLVPGRRKNDVSILFNFSSSVKFCSRQPLCRHIVSFPWYLLLIKSKSVADPAFPLGVPTSRNLYICMSNRKNWDPGGAPGAPLGPAIANVVAWCVWNYPQHPHNTPHSPTPHDEYQNTVCDKSYNVLYCAITYFPYKYIEVHIIL